MKALGRFLFPTIGGINDITVYVPSVTGSVAWGLGVRRAFIIILFRG